MSSCESSPDSGGRVEKMSKPHSVLSLLACSACKEFAAADSATRRQYIASMFSSSRSSSPIFTMSHLYAPLGPMRRMLRHPVGAASEPVVFLARGLCGAGSLLVRQKRGNCKFRQLAIQSLNFV